MKNLIDDSVEFVRTFFENFSLLPYGIKHMWFYLFIGELGQQLTGWNLSVTVFHVLR
jgi:hypothetical protein